MPQHKWHKEIKAWADGAQIQARSTKPNGEWYTWKDCSYPGWVTNKSYEYRIKPEPRTWWLLERTDGSLFHPHNSDEKAVDSFWAEHPTTYVKKHRYTEPE